MKLINVSGNTFYIKGGTNTGICIFEDNTALIIDPGLPGFRPRSIIKILNEKNIILKWIINTHEHDDHYGAGYQLKEEYRDLVNMSTKHSKLYIENPSLFSSYIIGGQTNRFMEDKLRNKNIKNIEIDKCIESGLVKLNNNEINIIPLKGHTLGSIGILTKDEVLFVGDALIGSEILNKFDLLFLYDIEEYIKTLELLKNIEFKYVVLGHGKEVLDKNSSLIVIDKHEKIVYKYIEQIRELLKKCLNLDEILKNIINLNKLSCNYKEYHFFKSTVISMISYLIKLNEIEYRIDNGELLYYTK